VLTAGVSLRAEEHSRVITRIQNAKEVFQELMETPDHAIPRKLIESAKCIAIIPGQKKAGFIVTAEYGKGLPHRARLDGSGLSDDRWWWVWAADRRNLCGRGHGVPQPRRISEITERQIQNRSGRHVGAATDLEMHAEILTYSRSRGVFAGVSLDGAVVTPDRKADEALYGRSVDGEAILNAKVPVPKAARELVAEIRSYTEGEKAAAEANRR
jgi:SH3 domain-containing YSC84-like protein 1